MKRNLVFSLLATLTAFAIVGCASQKEAAKKADAVAVLTPTKGNNVQGTVYFIKVADGVRVEGEVTGLKPGMHGFHVHEKGDCSAPDASSAGSHYNPTGMPHGEPSAAKRHIGDFGNIEANAGGIAHFSKVDHTISLEGPNSVIGHGLILHANPDDFSQPVGNAGPRVACGVIEKR